MRRERGRGWRCSSRGKYDLVFTDYVMPGMGGTELVEEIHKRCPSQPVIMVTAQATELRRQNAVPKGVDCLVDKPFGLEDVRGAVRGVMPERSLAA
ncbi:MAG: response regulator [Verrucomicrobiota bacterium]